MENKAFERFLRSLPADVVDSFNTHQLRSMSMAMQRESRRHNVDIRITIPFFWKSFYVVLLAGPERRSAERRAAERSDHPVWTPTNLLVLLAFVGLGVLISAGIWQLKIVAKEILLPEQVEHAYPVSIPFKGTQEECLESGRSWENGECIDYDHDRNF